ncbi:MAG: S8 family serine peptidase [Cyclobacteriaceae bacterium]
MKHLNFYHLHRLGLFCLLLNISLLAQAQDKSQYLSKVDLRLLDLPEQVDTKPSSTLDTSQNARIGSPNDVHSFQPGRSLVQNMMIVNGRVLIEATAVDDTQALLSRLESLGLQNGAAFGGMVSGWFPIDSIEKLNEVSMLRFVRPSMMKTNIGATTSQCDQAMFSDQARSQFKVVGRDNKIGVLSDSYNSLGGAPGGIASGDIPGDGNPNGYLHPVEVLEDLPDGAGIDEGRAMIEIIHDVAPAADLAFHTAFGGQANFAQGIVDLADAGSNIIVDDIFYFAEPFFQDGVITQATDIVANRGASYFSSAGNSGRDSYESPFRPTADTVILPVEIPTPDTTLIFPSPYIFHDFDPGPGVDIYQEITFNEGLQLFRASVQWDEPFASVCEGCPGAQSDLDVFVALQEDTRTIVYEASSYFNNIDGDAVEVPVYQFLSDSSSNTIQLLIGKYVEDPNQPDPNIVKYISFDDGDWEYETNSPTVVGHSNGSQVNSIGASFFFRNPLYFPDIFPLPQVNDFSSAGGNPILFNIEGSRIEPEMRVNPDVTGPDAGNTTFFIPGLFIGFEVPGTTEPDEFPQFTGTSASAPHVAAVAALMNEAAGEYLAPDEITEILGETATDLDDPFTAGFDEGYDVKTGFGYVNAQKAVASVFSLPSVVSFTLINATTDEEIGPLGDRVELSQIEGGQINIRADVIEGDGTVGSVIFALDGPTTQEQTESFTPYALFGDRQGDYNGEALASGDYTLTATPYTNLRGEGEEGIGLTVSFTVTRFPIAQLLLIDAEADQPIRPLENGDEINLRTTPQLTIEAIPEFENFDGSVQFILNGEPVQTENFTPYALEGDNPRGNYNVYPFEPGNYTLTVVPFSENRRGGESGDSLTVSFTVVDELAVTALVLINATTVQDLGELGDGAVLPLELLPPINIRAVVNDPSVGSVEFSVNGEIVNRDNDDPYLLLDDDDTDNLPPGVYQITATPFSREDGLGAAGTSLSIQIRLDLNLAVVQFLLIDAENDEPIGEIVSGDVLDISTLPPFNIEAVVNSNMIESVGFMLNGERVKIDNAAPYVLGTSDDFNYQPLDLDTGNYVLEATPYSADQLKGVPGTPLEVAFAVINSTNADTTSVAEAATFRVYPNPVAKTLLVRTEDQSDVIAHYTLIDNLGRQLTSSRVRDLDRLEVDITPYLPQIGPSRLFFLKITTNQGKTTTVRLRTE